MILEKAITKEEIQKRVLKNGKPLDLDLFEWIPERNEFKSDVDGLVIDFSDIKYYALSDNCNELMYNDFVFDYYPFDRRKCHCFNKDFDFNKGFIITIKNNSIVKCYLPCIIKAGHKCQFYTNNFCVFYTNTNCQFYTNDYCRFFTDDDCQFKTGSHCNFTTGNNCEFDTISFNNFYVEDNCIIKVHWIADWYYTIYHKGKNCTIIGKDDNRIIVDKPKQEKEESKFKLDETTKECLKELGIGFVILLSISLLVCFLCKCSNQPQPIITREIYIRMF